MRHSPGYCLCAVVQYFFQYVGPTFSAEFFDELTTHVTCCIRSYRDTLDRNQRRALLEALFHTCDQIKVIFSAFLGRIVYLLCVDVVHCYICRMLVVCLSVCLSLCVFKVSTIVLLLILLKKPIFITNCNVCYSSFILAL